MLVPIKNLGEFGVVVDTPAHELPPNAWSDARGVRFHDNAVWKAKGQTAVLGTPTVDPYFLYYHLGVSDAFWCYPGLAKVYATDGTTHSNITRTAGGDYTGDLDDVWSGCYLGGIEIFNNNSDTPQAWINPSLATPLVDLANWPASTQAFILRSFKQYLVAMDITKSSVRYPYLVKWSHPADPGSVPSSWDETDATKDAGEWPLAESGGYIFDARTLGDQLLIYKEDQTWSMSYIGGRFIFQFQKRFDTGIAGPRSTVEWKGKHYVALTDDIIVHDGFQQESILDDKWRRWYTGQVEPALRNRQYMVLNETENELWHCMPIGSTHPNFALIVNLKDKTTVLRELDEPTHIISAPYNATFGSTYDSLTTIPFEEMPGYFDQRTSQPSASRLIGVHRFTSPRFVLYDEGLNDEGSDFRGYVERLSMPIQGLDRFGQPVMDPQGIVMVNEIWPEIRQEAGTTVDIYVGGQETLNEPVTWEGPLTFNVGTDDKVDCCTVGRYISFRFETNDQSAWKLDGYAVNVEPLGQL
jgi:hypothetical protein